MNQTFDLFNRKNKKFLPQQGRKRELAETPKPRKRETALIFLVSLILNLLVAIVFHFIWHIGSREALSVTGQGFYFLYSKESPLLEILLIDPPLPTFLQLFFIPILKLFGITSFSGPLLSCLFGALSIAILNRILLSLRLPEAYRWILLGLTQCFPSFLYASAIGTSESMYIFVILLVIYGALQIRRNKMSFLICGFGLTLGFFIKYEVVSLIAGVALALIIFVWNSHDNWRKELEGWMLAFLTPPIYGITLWVILNVFLVSSPLYFLQQSFTPSHAPAVAKNVGILHPFFLGWDHFFEAISITCNKFWHLSLVFTLGIFIVIYLAFVNRRRHYISVLIMMLSVPAMLTLEIFFGILPPWLFIWTCAIPFGAILIGMVYQDIKPGWRDGLIICMFLLTIFSIYLNVNSLNDREAAIGEQRLHALLTGNFIEESRLRQSDPYRVYQYDSAIVAQALNQYAKDGKVLVDASFAAPIAFKVENPEQLIVIENLEYQTLFAQAAADGAYILVLNIDQPINEMIVLPGDPPVSSDDSWAKEIWSSEHAILNWQLFKIDIDFLTDS